MDIEINKIEIAHDVAIDRVAVDEKIGILDVRVIVNDNLIINIEMQNNRESNMEERSERYAIGIYSNNIKKGTRYSNIKSVILVNILNYNMFKNKVCVTDSVMLLRQDRKTKLRTKLKYYYIELPKLNNKKLDLNDELTQWLVYIHGKDKEVIEMVKEKNKMIKEIDKKVQYLQGEEEEIRIKELHDKWAFARYCNMRDAKKKGIIAGKREGKKNGIKAIAKRMFSMGYDRKQIMAITNISEKDLNKIIV